MICKMPFTIIPPDIMYTRYMQRGKIVRVARMDSSTVELLALYPSGNPGIFYGEACHRIDDVSPRSKIKKSDIKDEILERLLAGEPIRKIVREYEPSGDGEYHLCKKTEKDFSVRIRARIFSITEEEEPVSTRN